MPTRQVDRDRRLAQGAWLDQLVNELAQGLARRKATEPGGTPRAALSGAGAGPLATEAKAETVRPLSDDERRARRQRVDELVERVAEGIASWANARSDELDPFDVAELAGELRGMRGFIGDVLVARLGREQGMTLEASLFSDNQEETQGTLDTWYARLEEWEVNWTVDRAVPIHFRLLRADDVLEEIDAARLEQWEREEAERERVFQARVAKEKPRTLGWTEVVKEIRDAGHEPDVWGSPASLYGQARQIGVITDLEYEVAARRSGRGWHYAGD